MLRSSCDVGVSAETSEADLVVVFLSCPHSVSTSNMAVVLQKKMDTISAELDMIGEFIQETIVNIEEKNMNIKELRDCFDHVAKLYGLIENVQEIIDMIEPLNEDQKLQRRRLTELTEQYTTKVNHYHCPTTTTHISF